MTDESPAERLERRKYYRIDDIVLLRYVPAGDGGELVDVEARGSDAVSQLAEIDRELNPAINAVWREHPTIAQALGLLNRKLVVLAEHIEDGDGGWTPDFVLTEVNLSGCGVAFGAGEPLEPGTRVQLDIRLRPSQVTVSIGGTVLDCLGADDARAKPYRLRIDFDDDPQAQEQLIQHVVQKQAALLSGERTPD